MAKENFDAIDYLIFVIILLISLLIGLYQGFKHNIEKFLKSSQVLSRCRNCLAKKENSVDTVADAKEDENQDNADRDKQKLDEYLVANSNLGALPIALSLLATFFSATSILGVPAEIYSYGIQYWIIVFGMTINPVIGAFATGPFLSKFKILSVFEYLELRFSSKLVRLLGTTCYIIRMFISTAVYIYGPAASLSLFTNISDLVAIAIVGLVSTIYTTIGGIRGVIFTDVFQIIMMFVGLFAIMIKGLIDIGGFGNLWRINSEGGRLNLFNFDPDPFIRQSFWSLLIGNALSSLMSYGIDQQMMQRFRASKSKKTAQIALLLNIPGMFFILSFCCFVGLILYAVYAKCDPLTAPNIKLNSPNKLVGYYVLNNIGGVIPGMAGLFLASLFAAAMSSVSSTLNSMATIIQQDYLKMFAFFKNSNDKQSLKTVKLLVIICGLLSTGLSFLISTIGGNLVQISTSLNGAFIAPIIGLFLLGCLFSITNSTGACVSVVFGFFAGFWISFGSALVKPTYPKLGVSIEECAESTTASMTMLTFAADMLLNQTSITSIKPPVTGFKKFYYLSYMWYTAFGILVTLITGIVTSLLTGGLKSRETLNKEYVLFDLLGCCFKTKAKVEDVASTEERVNDDEPETVTMKTLNV